MFKKLALITALVLVLAPVSVALAANKYYSGAGETDSWADGANWGGTVPASGDLVFMRGLHGSTSNVTDVSTTDCVGGSVLPGYGTPSIMPSGPAHTLNILNGGTLTCYSAMQAAGNAGAATGYAVATINVYSGGKITCDGSAYFNLTHPSGGTSSENGGHGTLNMYGGLIDFSQSFNVSRNATGNHYGEVHLDGGEIYAASLYMGFHTREDPEDPDRWTPNTIADSMDFSGGVMYIKGDIQTQVEGYVSNGWITAYDGAGALRIETGVSLTGHQAGDGEYTKIYAEIPEPGTMLLAGFGVLLLLVTRRKR